MQRRITGIETEYGIACVKDGRQRMNADAIAYQFFKPVIREYRSSNVFTRNGSRLYLDVGSHPEYATCECDTLRQLLTYVRAGDTEMNKLAREAETFLHNSDIGGEVYLFKNNTDASGATFGSHENYLIERHVDYFRLSQALIPFLVTRQLICGAGKVYCDPETGETTYRLSQRAEHVFDGVSSATTRSRPMINTRDEPLADSHRFRRMHVIVGDSSMSERTFFLKIGSMLLMLEMLEGGVDFPDLMPQDPIAAIRHISVDLSGRAEYTIAGSSSRRSVSALEVQEIYCNLAEQWLDRREPDAQSEDFAEVVRLWSTVLTSLRHHNYEALQHDIDWAIKKMLIDRHCARAGVGLDDPRCAQLDLTYHDIREDRGVFPLLECKGFVPRMTTEEEVLHACDIPPSSTRASARGRFVAAALGSDTPFAVDWSHLKRLSYDPHEIEINDPFVPTSPEVEELISSVSLPDTEKPTVD